MPPGPPPPTEMPLPPPALLEAPADPGLFPEPRRPVASPPAEQAFSKSAIKTDTARCSICMRLNARAGPLDPGASLTLAILAGRFQSVSHDQRASFRPEARARERGPDTSG